MIITLEDTTTAEVAGRLLDLREEGGVVTLGRVLTLVIIVNGNQAEQAIDAANRASREHPCRVIVVEKRRDRDTPGMDAEIRIGAHAGASDVVLLRPYDGAANEVDTLVMPLLLPDAPIVAWWPNTPPDTLAKDPLGVMAQRRISDVGECAPSIELLLQLRKHYSPGDTDLSWARTTLWRGITAACMDEVTSAVTAVTVYGALKRPSTHLFAAWLAAYLDLDVTLVPEPETAAITGVVLTTTDGDISLHRPDGSTVVTIKQPGQVEHEISMPKRTLEDCLMEDLRRLDPDEVYERTLTTGLERVKVAK